MFYYLSGSVAHIGANLAVIDCGGVGFAVNTTAYTLSTLENGKNAKLFTHCYIREDSFDIYGFASERERSCFEQLIGVSGVGPKAALSILSCTTPEGFALAVMNEDVKTLTMAPGIGKKIAQRIVLELKDKLAGESAGFDFAAAVIPAAPAGNRKAEDAQAALAVLGYSAADIAAALRDIDMEANSLEAVVRLALKKMIS